MIKHCVEGDSEFQRNLQMLGKHAEFDKNNSHKTT